MRGQVSRARGDCRCGERGCLCDLAAQPDVGELMQFLGYDRCVDDGQCEKCSSSESLAAHCAATGQRQKVVCLRCDDFVGAQLPLCSVGYRTFWAAHNSEAMKDAGNTTGQPAASAGLFFRSCGSQPKAKEPTAHTSNADGAEQVFCFLLANAAVLFCSAWSLRRQQQKSWEQTMQGLLSCVEEGTPAGSLQGSGSVTSSRTSGNVISSPSRDQVEATEWRSPPGEQSVPSIGRSIESMTKAVGRSGAMMEGSGGRNKKK